MLTRKYLLIAASIILLSGCNDEVDLINIEVKDDLSTNVQIVVSPIDTNSDSASSPDVNTPTVDREKVKEEYFQKTKEEFESCGFDVRKNLRYDEAGVSGSQSFSSRTNLEQAFSCLSYVTGQIPPIELNYPTKRENLFQTNYELQIGVQNPDVFFGYDFLFDTKPVKEIRITLPGRIINTSTRNQTSNVLFNQAETDSGAITFSVEEVKSTDSNDERMKEFLEQLDIHISGFDYKRLVSQNQDEVNQANQELALLIKEQIGIDIFNNPEAASEYVKTKIPPYTTIVINSRQSKIDINIVVTVAVAILPFFIGFLVFLYKKKK
jgi:hypothetical protein